MHAVVQLRAPAPLASCPCCITCAPHYMCSKMSATGHEGQDCGITAQNDQAVSHHADSGAHGSSHGGCEQKRLCINPANLNKAMLRQHDPMKTVEKVIANMPDTKTCSILDAKCDFWQVPFRVLKTHHLTTQVHGAAF